MFRIAAISGSSAFISAHLLFPMLNPLCSLRSYTGGSYLLSISAGAVQCLRAFLFYSFILSREPLFLRFLTHSVNKYSIWPLMDRKSSSAQADRSSHNCGEMRRRSCFFPFPSVPKPLPSPCKQCISFSAFWQTLPPCAAHLIKRAGVDDGLRILVSAQHHQEI